jgi:hypothetical protein
MKKSAIILVILAFVLAFGMVFLGCGDDTSEDEEEEEVETIDNNAVYESGKPASIPNVLEGVTTAADWTARRNVIKTSMQNNYYGIWKSGETVTYSISGTGTTLTLTVDVKRSSTTYSFTADVQLPTTAKPANGYPVIFAFGALDGPDGMMGSKGNPRQYALDKGYANISVPTSSTTNELKNIASDNNNHQGVFYNHYPYNASSSSSQTGVLMAWAWGASKVLDALVNGAAAELGIDASKTIITGTSRNGKAAAVAGAFDERFKITVPVSSGAGGAAIYRYNSKGQTYDLSKYYSYNNAGKWTVDGSNPQSLSSVQGDSGGGWFNEQFKKYLTSNLPFDQHFLLSMAAGTDRALFMINGFEWDKWTNPPGFFYAFELTKPVFDLLGIPENIAVSMHRYRHGIEQEDMVKLIKFANNFFYNEQDLTFEYAETGKPKPATWAEFMADLHRTPFSK